MPPRCYTASRQPSARRERILRWLKWSTFTFATSFAAPALGQAAGLERGHVATRDAEELLTALQRRSDAAAVDALCDFIRQGQSDALTDRALGVLAQKRAKAALPLLGELSRHRRPSARRASYAAIAAIADPRADVMLGQGLRDSDPTVRGVCAHALGERGARTQLGSLFVALERGVPGAGAAIGKLADAGALARLHGLLERLPLPPILAAYEAVLLRADVATPVKLDVVARIGALWTPGAQAFLTHLMAVKHDWAAELEVLRAIADAASRIDTPPSDAKGKPP